MPLTISSNIQSLQAQRKLGESSSTLGTVFVNGGGKVQRWAG